ncbi:hypothetical protein FDENT_4644 [Fusarium denticulatum]|uniref:BTB domain-containing protein n=1 Tax=Fusarium denticulatum TaxID=48507 RepID=A0A8H5UG36_9HYPO|nr:hypothetical protein FDENT_4644 [Fusarium denticulatum]
MNEPTVARGVPLDVRCHVFDDLLSPVEDEEDPDTLGTITWGSRSVALAEENAIKVRTTLEGEVRIRVSSRHLILASCFFRSALGGPWREASTTSSFFGKPLRQIIAYEWDAVAFALVLDIIHGRHRGVPRFVDIMLLTRIATIVDFYHCQEVVQIFGDHWYGIDNLLWSEYSSRTLMWLFISWVFSGEDAFNKATEMTLGHMDDPSNIDTKELNLNGILTKINDKRQELINEIVAALHNLRDTLPHSDFLCDWHKYDSPSCSSIALCILGRELQRLKSGDRPLVAPFNGYSVIGMIQLVNYIPESIGATTEEYGHYHDVLAKMSAWTLDLDKNVRSG